MTIKNDETPKVLNLMTCTPLDLGNTMANLGSVLAARLNSTRDQDEFLSLVAVFDAVQAWMNMIGTTVIDTHPLVNVATEARETTHDARLAIEQSIEQSMVDSALTGMPPKPSNLKMH